MKEALEAPMLRYLISCICLLVTVVAPRTLGADVVHLTNGRAMEGVVREETPEQVILQLPFGEIKLPRSNVRLVELGRSSLQEYLERRSELELEQAGASDWVELALWAQREGLDHSAREATLIASRLDPGLPGLIPLMLALGYEYEENLAVWMPYDELMRRRGYALVNGRWLSPSQAVAFQREQEAAMADQLDRQRRDRLARAMEMMVLAQIARAEEARLLREEASTPSYGLPIWGGFPVFVGPGYPLRPRLRPEHHHRGRGEGWGTRESYREAIVRRPPGSLIPVAQYESHGGTFQKP